MYLFNLLLLIFSIQFQNKFIENQNISIEFDFELTEETKKKNTYKIKFTLKNKKNKPLYYVADYIKSETKININNTLIFPYLFSPKNNTTITTTTLP